MFPYRAHLIRPQIYKPPKGGLWAAPLTGICAGPTPSGRGQARERFANRDMIAVIAMDLALANTPASMPRGEKIVLTSEWTERNRAMAVPGAWWDRDTRAWVLTDPTPRGAAAALKLFPRLAVEHPDLIDIRNSLAMDVRPTDYAKQYATPIHAPTVREQLWSEGKDFYEFQSIDLGYIAAVLEQHGGAYLGWERGLGKTLGACAIIDALECRATLVVCPNTAKLSVWAAELERWLPEHQVIVMPNDKAKRERAYAEVRQLMTEPRFWTPKPHRFVLVTHYENLLVTAKMRASDKGGWKRLGEWDLVICDEAHRIKNPDAQMTRQLKRIPTRRRLALSGTILSNHAEELFSQLQWLFPGRYASKWRDWNDRYLDYLTIPEQGKVCLGVRVETLAQMRDELGRFMVYRRKEDELDLPERTWETRRVELTAGQRKAYDDLERQSLAKLEDGSILVAPDGLSLLSHLRQIATGLDLVSGELVDSSKQDLAVEMIKDNPDEAFVVFSWYKAAAYSLRDRLLKDGIAACVITGDVNATQRSWLIRDFQAGEFRVIIGTISTMGESVTLTRANNAIFLDRSWNPGDNDQAADRIYRIGQQNAVTVTDIVAADTVDESRVLPILTDKRALRDLILGARPKD